MIDKLHLVDPRTLVGRLITQNERIWQAYVGHEFVRRLAAGTLPEECFRRYLVQDYLFLVHFSRAWALAAFKADKIDEIRACAAVLDGLANQEMRLHVDYCAKFGLDESTLERTAEASATMAYTRYVLERGLAGDLLDLLVALAPCVVGYGEIGAQVAADPATRIDDNPYRLWIETYAGDDYVQVVRTALAQIERVAMARLGDEPWTTPRWTSLSAIFEAAARLEIDFWQMGLDG